MTEKHVQLDYDLSDIPPRPWLPDLEFCFRRMAEVTLEAAWRPQPGRILDVGCGAGKELLPFVKSGWEAWGVEPSTVMLGLAALESGPWLPRLHLVRAIGESLPFADHSFDRVICKGAIDHFADTAAFASEATRVLKPDGRLIITLTNFQSLSFRLGRWLHPLHLRLGLVDGAGRPYWWPPGDHTFVGDYKAARRLGADELVLERSFGASMLWLLPGWGQLLRKLPATIGQVLLNTLDVTARRTPALSDVIVTVWMPRRGR